MSSALRCAQLSADLDTLVGRREAAAVRLVSTTRPALAELTRTLSQHAARIGALTRSVLIVEDDVFAADMMALTIASALAVPVHVAHTIAEATARWSRHRSRVAGVDLHLGAELGAVFAHGLDRGVRVVLTSGVADRATLDAVADRDGAIALPKPPEPPTRLVELVAAALDPNACGRTRLA